MSILLSILMLLPATAALAQGPDTLVLGDFEIVTWRGLTKSEEQVKSGQYAGKWADLKSNPSIQPARVPADWSSYDRLILWVYSAKANGQGLTLVCNSDNPADKEGWDYYFHHFRVDWEGWKLLNLRLGEDIQGTRKPKGWDQIDYLSISATGWEHHPLEDTVLYFDDVRLVRDPAKLEVAPGRSERAPDGSTSTAYALTVTNRSARPRSFLLQGGRTRPAGGAGAFDLEGLPERTSEIAAGETLQLTARLTATPARLAGQAPLSREEFVVQVPSDIPDIPGPEVILGAAVPLPGRQHPFLFGDRALLDRALQRAEKYEWARAVLDGILQQGEAAVEAELAIPDEGGQWGHHYVCKKCGARLRHEDGKHICQRCGAEYTGWPYDQVIVAGTHSRNWSAVQSLGLAYAFTGKEAYAEKARRILLAYADKYTTYPLHNVQNKLSSSAARVFAQTLDEACAIIGVAWGYDLIYDSPCFSPEDRRAIEDRFLREVVQTIRRNDSGISNWQSWHNAGVAAVGFCLQDEELASHAIHGKSGLVFQLENSVLKDGFWYEGTAAYHYYALDALRWTTEAAYYAGIDFYGNAVYKSLYDAPILYVTPSLEFPAVNDSDIFSIKGRHGFYDFAFARFGDPTYLTVAAGGKRNSREALLWGAEELPQAPDLALESRDFTGLGAAVLRQGAGEEQMYVHLDYGPHGGGHGHPDKLTVILHALGTELAPDPGRLAYGAPLQGSWYRQTFAHNTVCVDGRSQQATEGRLTLFSSQPGLAIATASCDTAYPGVAMQRTVALTDGYTIDLYSVESEEEHTYDWLWHNFGELVPGLPVEAGHEPPGETAGYQHMLEVSAAVTADTWFADFKQERANVRLTMLGVPDTNLYFGTGMAHNPPRPCPMVVARREGRQALFVSVIEPYRTEARVTGLELLPVEGEDGALALRVLRGQEHDVLMVADAPGRRTFGTVDTTARACFTRVRGGQVVSVVHVEG